MNVPFQLTPELSKTVWWIIAEDNRDAADRAQMQIFATMSDRNSSYRS
jgi:hypothetical protein